MTDTSEDRSLPGEANGGMSRRNLLGLSAILAAARLTGLDVLGGSSGAAHAATQTLYWPTVSRKGVSGGEYGADRGPNHSPRYHQGYDVAIPVGTTLYGCGNGTVSQVVADSGGYGKYVLVTYEDVTVITAHMSSTNVSVGNKVTTSTVLGLSGGAAGSPGAGDSTGPHCHVEVKKSGVLTDPTRILVDRSLIGTTPNDPNQQNQDDEMAVIISAKTPTYNGIWLAAPGFWHLFTSEEYTQFTAHGLNQGLKSISAVNDRDLDVLRATFTKQTS